jgi:hypothetical protein
MVRKGQIKVSSVDYFCQVCKDGGKIVAYKHNWNYDKFFC